MCAGELNGEIPQIFKAEIVFYLSGRKCSDAANFKQTGLKEYGMSLVKTFPYAHFALPAASLLLLLSSSITHAAEGNAFKGEALYAICAGCHGADAMGSEAANAPRLQGQFNWYLVRQLENYRSGARGVAKGDKYGATMRAMAATLPDEQAIKDVVAYIDTL